MATVDLEQINKVYPNGFHAVKDLNLDVGDGAGLLHIDDDASAPARIRSFITSARPGAVITGSDKIAAMVYSAAAELNLRVGRDLAVTGFDGSMRAELLHPRLTTVAIPVDDIAQRVIGRVLRQLDHGPDSEPGEIVPAPLRLAGSTSRRPDPEPGQDRVPDREAFT